MNNEIKRWQKSTLLIIFAACCFIIANAFIQIEVFAQDEADTPALRETWQLVQESQTYNAEQNKRIYLSANTKNLNGASYNYRSDFEYAWYQNDNEGKEFQQGTYYKYVNVGKGQEDWYCDVRLIQDPSVVKTFHATVVPYAWNVEIVGESNRTITKNDIDNNLLQELSVEVTGDTAGKGIRYSWQKDYVTIDCNTASYQAPPEKANYQVTVYVGTESITKSFSLKIASNLRVENEWREEVVVDSVGGPATLTVRGAENDFGAEGISYRWSEIDEVEHYYKEIEGEASASITLESVNKIRDIQCQISDTYGESKWVYFSVRPDSGLKLNGSNYQSISVNPNQTAQLSMDVICNEGETITYEWQISNSWPYESVGTDKTFTTPLVTKRTQYRCTATDQYGYSVNKYFSVGVETGLKITNNSWNDRQIIVDKGDSARLEVIVTAEEGTEVSYKWYKGSTSTDNLQSEMTNVLNTGAVNEHEEYICEVSDQFGNSDYAHFYINVNSGLSVNQTWYRHYVDNGDDDTLVVYAESNSGNLTYTWYKVDENRRRSQINPTDADKPYKLDVENISYAQEYVCEVTDEFGGTESVTFEICVNSNLSLKYNSEVTANIGDTVELSVTPTSSIQDNQYTYKWIYRGSSLDLDYEYSVLQNESADKLELNNLQKAGVYCCEVTDRFGSTESANISVKINNGLNVSVTPETVNFEQGNSTVLRASASAADSADLEYVWKKGYDDAGKGETLSVDKSGTYTCYVKDKYGNVVTDSAKVTVDSGFSASADGNTYFKVNSGESVTAKVNASSNGTLTYRWYVNNKEKSSAKNKTSLTVTPKIQTFVRCLISDEYGNNKTIYYYIYINTGFSLTTQETVEANASQPLTLEVTASGGKEGAEYSYSWYKWDESDGSYNSLNTASKSTYTIRKPVNAKYMCSVTDGCDSKSAVINVTVGESSCGHTELKHVEAVDATCEAAGNIEYWICDDCKSIFSDGAANNAITMADTVVAALGHKLTKTTAKAATCTENGNRSYWTCERCKKHFSDENGKTEIAQDSWVTNATGHNMTEHQEKATTCTQAGNSAYWSCDKCKKYFSDENGETEIEADSWVIKALGHNMTEHQAKSVTCTENGNSAYWSCDRCEKYFSDAEGNEEITANSWVIKAPGHNMTAHDAVDATCTEAGNSAYWSCDRCKKYFSDKNGSKEIAEDSWVIGALGHNMDAHEAKAATCTEEGNSAYWYCNRCKLYFSDADGKTKIEKDSWVLDALGHDLKEHKAKKPTYEEDGNSTYWSCDRCNKYFSDADSNTEIEKDSWVLEALWHSTAGIARIQVVDQNGAAIKNAPVYFNLGSENRIIKNTGTDGFVEFKAAFGTYDVGCFTGDNKYLPAKKTITITDKTTTEIRMALTERTMIEGRLETEEMTIEEIAAAGIDVNDPDNQNIAKVTVTLKYKDQVIRKTTFYNYKTKASSGFGSIQVGGYKIYPSIITKKGVAGGNGGTGGSSESDLSIAVGYLVIPVEASALKEFFNVDLQIINNADEEFPMINNEISLNVPDGLTLMDTNVSESSNIVQISEIAGQTTQTISWIVRGDKIGKYNLSADYTGTLALFNEELEAHFQTEDPLEVRGLSDLKLNVLVPETIRNGKLYYATSLSNEGDRDINRPNIDVEANDVLLASKIYAASAVDIRTIDKAGFDSLESITASPNVLHPDDGIVKYYSRDAGDSFNQKVQQLKDYYYTAEDTYGLQIEITTVPWYYFARLFGDLSCGENLTWEYEDGVLHISGTGAMEEYGPGEAPWYQLADDINIIVVDSGATEIYEDAFYGCTSIREMHLPKSLTYISTKCIERKNAENIDCYFEGSAQKWTSLVSFGTDVSDPLMKIKMHYGESSSSGTEDPVDGYGDEEIEIKFGDYSAQFGPNELKIDSSKGVYNRELTMLCAILNESAYINDNDDSKQDLKSIYKKMDMKETAFGTYNGGFRYGMAYRPMWIDGKVYNVVVVTARGTNLNIDEFLADMSPVATQYSWGYKSYDAIYEYEDRIIKRLNDFVNDNNLDKKPLKVIITGHSLGGAAANLLAARFTNFANEGAWWSSLLSKNDIYAYTFGSIDSIKTSNPVSDGFDNIHNVYNLMDTYGPNGNRLITAAGNTINGKFGHIDLFSKDFRPLYEKIISNMRLPYFLIDWGSVIIDGVAIADDAGINHSMSSYLYAIATSCATENKTSYKRIRIKCPVDIDVYADERLVGRVRDNEVVTSETTLDMVVSDNAKYIVFPNDKNYIIRIKATDDGTMSYQVTDMDGETAEEITYTSVNLTKDKLFESKTGRDIIAKDTQLTVVNENNIALAEVQTDGIEKPITQGGGSGGGGAGGTGGGAGAVEESDQAASDKATSSVNNLPSADNVSLEDKAAIEAARAAYDALTPAQKDLVDKDIVAKLEAAEAALKSAERVKAAEDVVDDLPDADSVKTSDIAAIESAQALYDKLTDAEKARFDKNNKAKLEAVVAALAKAELKAASTINKTTVKHSDVKIASDLGATTVILGPKVKKVSKNAFKGTKITTIIVKTKKLTAKKVKGSLKGSRVKSIKVKVSSKKKINKKYIKKYRKIFTKKNSGGKMTVK